MDAGLIVSRLIHFASLAFLVGAGWAPVYADLAGVHRPLRWLQRGAVILALASGLSWFAFAVAGMAGAPLAALDPSLLRSTMQETGFGQVWLVRTAGLILLAALLFWASPGRARWAFEAALSGVLLASIALTGHAQAQEGMSLLIHGSADALHLLAAGIWLGGLGVLLLLLSQSTRPDGAERARAALERFSTTGIIAVAIILSTGIANGFFLVGSLGALVSTAYGQILCLKIAMFLGMVALAGVNRAASRRSGMGLGPMTARVAFEQILGFGVLGVVAFLGTMAPATAS